MKNLMKTLLHKFRAATEDIGMFHPFLFQNHAFEEQDVFAGYGETNLRRLREIRKKVDPKGIFQTLQPGYFKLESHGTQDVQFKSEL
jgi:hypothetical protein